MRYIENTVRYEAYSTNYTQHSNYIFHVALLFSYRKLFFTHSMEGKLQTFKIRLIKIQSFPNLAGLFVFRSIENFIAVGRTKISYLCTAY